MTSKEYAAARRERIGLDGAMVYPDRGEPTHHSRGQSVGSAGTRSPPSRRPAFAETTYAGSTTTFSVADRFGNVVACTPTLGSEWDTGVIVGDTGLFFNNGTRIGSTSPYPDDVNYVRGDDAEPKR